MIPFITCFLNIGCTGNVHVHSGYVVKAGLTKYSNYIWLQTIDSLAKTPGANTVFNEELKKAIDRHLASIGFIINNSQPYLIVHYHLVLRDDATIRSLESEKRNRYSLRDRVEIYKFLKSTLIIDMVDSKSGDIIWWGVATEVMFENSDDLTSKQIEIIVRKIFRTFPGRHRLSS